MTDWNEILGNRGFRGTAGPENHQLSTAFPGLPHRSRGESTCSSILAHVINHCRCKASTLYFVLENPLAELRAKRTLGGVILMARETRDKGVDVLEEIVRHEGSALLAYARSVTGHAQDAEDALQEAMSRLARQRLSGVANLRAYVYKAIRNAALNNSRTQVRRARREEVSSGGEGVIFQEPASRREELDALNAAVAALPREQREVVLMRIWGGMSFAEVAEVIEISCDMASSRYRYAVEALRKRMRVFIDAQG